MFNYRTLALVLTFLSLFLDSFNVYAKEISDRELRKLSQEGNINASYNLGVRNLKRGDAESAFRYFIMAADAGFPQGQYQAAQLYRRGKGTKENHAKALELYRRAQDGNVKNATFYLLLIQSDSSSSEYNPVNASILLETMSLKLTEGRKKLLFENAVKLPEVNNNLSTRILVKLSETGFEPAAFEISMREQKGKNEHRGANDELNSERGPQNFAETKSQTVNPKDAVDDTPSSQIEAIDEKTEINKRMLSSQGASRIQRRLQDLAYYDGSIDGVWGLESEKSLGLFATDIGKELPINLDEAALLRVFVETVFETNARCSREINDLTGEQEFSCFYLSF